ncbi:hypothetical protein PROFUN_04414 [Planoprotostelium fungivorum]|uniref:Uncharacterized protein n=1 Tax=Planoprotostelium fungivorum TaxID=1890364 RepID=A0A2P6NHV2_9EUKA|nr:hypothetical protein PROFUN_04414 [Planoprotostelium fungivorum]
MLSRWNVPIDLCGFHPSIKSTLNLVVTPPGAGGTAGFSPGTPPSGVHLQTLYTHRDFSGEAIPAVMAPRGSPVGGTTVAGPHGGILGRAPATLGRSGRESHTVWSPTRQS